MSRRRHKQQHIQPFDLTLTADRLGFQGEALARHGEDLVFIPYAIPGEQVEATVWRKTGDYLEADLKRVITPSPDRVEPPCPYYTRCTGCEWQHIAYPRQLQIKSDLVADHLRRTGAFDAPPVLPTIGCDDPWAYRNHARFTVRKDGQLGFVNRSRRYFVRIDRCLIMDEGVNRILAQLQDKCGETSQLSIRYGVNTGDYLVQPTLQSLDVTIPVGQTHYTEELNGRRFRIASPSFFQVNTRQAARLIDLVRERLALTPADTLVDAYAGVGVFAALLAPHVQRVLAIEESSSAIADAQQNMTGLANVEMIEGKTEAILPTLQGRADAVILDPPRAGCHRSALDALIALRPSRIAYVSCDPATLARDLRILCESAFDLVEVQPIDLFPHTHHIEVVATLRARPAPSITPA